MILIAPPAAEIHKPTPTHEERCEDAIGRTPDWFAFTHRVHRSGTKQPNVEFSVAFELDGERFTYCHPDIDVIVERIETRPLTRYEKRERCCNEIEEAYSV